MNVARVAARIARFGDEPGQPKIPHLVYRFFGHVETSDVAESPLDEESKSAVVNVLLQKARLQALFDAWSEARRRLRGEDKAFERVAVEKAPVVDALSHLMRVARPKIERGGKWSPKHDDAFDAVARWKFPTDPEKGWWIDVWTQAVHDLATAVFSSLLDLSKQAVEKSSLSLPRASSFFESVARKIALSRGGWRATSQLQLAEEEAFLNQDRSMRRRAAQHSICAAPKF
jgi:hypothetical protein